MTMRLGIGVGSNEVRAALMKNGRVHWHGARPVSGAIELQTSLASLLAEAPLPRYTRVRAVAAIGPSMAQAKRLTGLPQDAKSAVISQVVHGNVGRFFLKSGVPLAVGGMHRAPSGWWASALDAPIVQAVESACQVSRVRLEGCIPTVAAFALLMLDGPTECEDDGVRASIEVVDGEWRDGRRNHGATIDAEAVPPSCAEPAGIRFADAVSAAHCNGRSALLLRAARRSSSASLRLARRSALAAVVLIAAGAALFGPGTVAARTAARDDAQFERLRSALIAWGPVSERLNTATKALDDLARFQSERQSGLLFLAALAKALPDSTAIASVRMDSAGVTMTLQSRAASSILPRLASVPGIIRPRIVGAVTREIIGETQLQRVTVRYQFPDAQEQRVRR